MSTINLGGVNYELAIISIGMLGQTDAILTSRAIDELAMSAMRRPMPESVRASATAQILRQGFGVYQQIFSAQAQRIHLRLSLQRAYADAVKAANTSAPQVPNDQVLDDLLADIPYGVIDKLLGRLYRESQLLEGDTEDARPTTVAPATQG